MFFKFFWTFILFNHCLLSVIDFEKEVWPILEERCIECHMSPYEKNGLIKLPKAGLRLDGAAYIMHGSDDGAVVVVDHPSKSSLYQRVILPEDDSDHMPPKGGSLSRTQKETFRMWIAQGLDFGTWVGATDGIDAISERKKDDQLPQASYLAEIDQLALGLSDLGKINLEQISEKSGLLVRPLGIGSKLLEVRVVTDHENVTDKSLQSLIPMRKHIVKLDLRNTSITDQSLVLISSFPRLLKLNLMGTSIRSDAISSLAENKALESLNLVNTRVSDSIVDSLASLPKLRQLYLWRSSVTSKGISSLRRMRDGLEVSY
tara:strand:+ start:93 stop:1043 length:951 start_codon:yes stop_codon:yes gene_type:complete